MKRQSLFFTFALIFCAPWQGFSAIPAALIETNAELELRGMTWRLNQEKLEQRNITRGQTLGDRYAEWSAGTEAAREAVSTLALEGGKQWGQEAQSWADRTPGVRTPASVLVAASTFYTGREIRYRLTDQSRVGFRSKLLNHSGSVFFEDQDLWSGLIWSKANPEPLLFAVRRPLVFGFSGSVEIAQRARAQAVLSRPLVEGIQASVETHFSGEGIFRLNYGLNL